MKLIASSKDHLKNEKIQIYIRFGVFVFLVVFLGILQVVSPNSGLNHALYFSIAYIVFVGLIYFLLRFKPKQFYPERIIVLMAGDIASTMIVIYYLGPVSALLVSFPLWYIIGYGMRYGVRYALTGTVLTISAWCILFLSSPYWHQHPFHFMGWLIAFIILPLYYFLMVHRLHATLHELSAALNHSERLATRDHLTGLANRYHFSKVAQEKLTQGQALTFLMFDLDGFKTVNDQFGHQTGDQLLIQVAQSLERCCPANGLVGRLGGDEFIAAIPDCSPEESSKFANQILSTVSETTGKFREVTASIGICRCPGDADTLSRAKSYSDCAMYAAKKQGKNRYCHYVDLCAGDNPAERIDRGYAPINNALSLRP
jgi:diguanylate cyclase (GGDEF)-like protein